jgi:alkaline phosphatase
VIFGGGRRKFIPLFSDDYADIQLTGDRFDKKNLIDEWIEKMKIMNKSHKFIWNATDLRKLKMKEYDHVLGK